MMLRAQTHEVRKAGPAAIRPMMDVMCLEEARAAAGEAASTISNLQRAAEPLLHGSPLPFHLARTTVPGFADTYDPGIACDAAGRFS